MTTSHMNPNYINGEWVAAERVLTDVNPSDLDDVVGRYAEASAAQVGEAVAAARAAFPAWSRRGIQERADILDRIGTEILARKEELGRLLSREEGKTLPEGIGEAARAGYIFRFFAGEVLRARGELLDSVRPGIGVEISREALGVVGLVTPWNFPLAIPAWKIAPALAYGNCVVFKPSELAPACAWAIAEILARAGLPAGVFNLVMGGGATGEALTHSPGLDAISFTGSQATGARVAAIAAERGVRLQLEMGGKNPLVVLDDADLAVAVNCAVQGAYYSTGQRCTASSRLIVTEGIHDRFVAALVERLGQLKVDDALAPGTDIGPVVDARQLEKDLDYIRIAQEEGARLAFGGTRLERAKRGHYLAPTLFAETTAAMRINREEVFGPVASVIRAKDYDEALALANDSPFGLCASIVTTALKHAADFKRNAEVGMVMVNLPTAGVDYHVPFGGRKGSSHGPREQGAFAREFYTTVKTAYVLA